MLTLTYKWPFKTNGQLHGCEKPAPGPRSATAIAVTRKLHLFSNNYSRNNTHPNNKLPTAERKLYVNFFVNSKKMLNLSMSRPTPPPPSTQRQHPVYALTHSVCCIHRHLSTSRHPTVNGAVTPVDAATTPCLSLGTPCRGVDEAMSRR